MKKFWLENEAFGDFPFYNDRPFPLSVAKWIAWFVITVGGMLLFTGDFILLFKHINLNPAKTVAKPLSLGEILLNFGVTILFVLILVGVIWFISKKNLRFFFKKLKAKEVWFSIALGVGGMIFFALYNTFIIRGLFKIHTVDDSAVNLKSGMSLLNFVQLLIQLIGEEITAIVPFLFVLWLCSRIFKWNRSVSIVLAWIISSVIFGIYHLTAYDGSWTQVILIIAVSRMILTVPYIRYKNIWASYITHVSYDLPVLLLAVLTGLLKK